MLVKFLRRSQRLAELDPVFPVPPPLLLLVVPRSPLVRRGRIVGIDAAMMRNHISRLVWLA